MEQGSKTKKIITTTTTSMNKREEVPVKTSQSLNTESYEYFHQKITTKNNLTESSLQASNQKVQNSSLKCTCNQGSSAQKNFQEIKCTCGKRMSQAEQQQKCTCGLSHGITGSNQTKIKTTTTTTNYNNVNSNINTKINTNVKTKANINVNAKVSSNVSASAHASLAKSGQRISTEKKEINVKTEGKVCNCNQSANEKVSSKTTITKKSLMMTKQQIDKKMKLKQEWNLRCVGQNNENLQILAGERPELLVQYVQDMKVIQEPRPVQILIPAAPNEIDYPLGLEIYGKEKKVLICPENIDDLNVSKAYSTIKPHFENLGICQSEKVFLEKAPKKELNIEHDDLNIQKSKKDRYDMPLTLENGEMFVKGEKSFNKNNEVELTTKMNLIGKHKITWNESNEAIKTTKMNIDKTERTQFDNLYVENNTYKYQGQKKNKYSSEEINLEQNEDMTYPREYTKQNWNESTHPMSGKPFTLVGEKKPCETLDWNKKNNKRREVQINMIKKAKKKHLAKQRVTPVIINGQENNWNNLVKEENDSNINIEKTAKLNEFDISHGDEVHILNEKEEILVNDDYNIVEDNYTRPVRANIKKITDFSEESVSSEYDILKGIKKYTGQYQYKDLVDESLKIQGQKIIINDISGKYPRRVETFRGLDENFAKLANDQYKGNKRNFNVEINQVNIEKRVMVNKQPLHEYHFVQKYEYEKKGDYEHESYEKFKNEPEDAQETQPEQEQEMEVPEDKDQGLDQIQIHQRQEQSQEAEAEGEEENNEPEMEEQYPEEEQENENLESKEQYYYLKQNEERNDSEPHDEVEPEEQGEINANEEEEAKDTLQKNEDQNEPQEHSTKVYIKEITYTKGKENAEGNVTNLRYITIKKKEEQEDSNSQPNDHNEEQEEKEIKQQEEINEDKKEEKKEIKEEIKIENQYQYVTMLSQPVEEQHMSRDENDIKSDLEKEIEKKEEIKENKEEQKIEGQNKEEIKEESKKENQYQYVTMLSQPVEEQHMSRDEGEPDNELDEEIKKKEENNALEIQDNQEKLEEYAEKEVEELVEKRQEEQSQQQIEEHAEHHMEEKVEDKNKEQVEENVEEHVEEHVEDNDEGHVEEHVEDNDEEHVEEHVEDNDEEHVMDNDEEHVEEQVMDNDEEHIEDNNENKAEEQMEEHFEEQEEHLEHQENEQEVHNEEQNLGYGQQQEIKGEEIHQQEQGLKEHEKKAEIIKEGKRVSEIVAEAIQEEMKRQELKEIEKKQKGKEDKYNLMVNAYTKQVKENPPDNYYKFATNKLNIIPKVSKLQLHPVQTISKTVQTQTISQVQTSAQQKIEETSNANPMMYSFGQGSVEEARLSGDNQNALYGNSVTHGRVFTFGQEGLTTTNIIPGSNLYLGEKVDLTYSQSQISSSGQGMSGKYYFTKGYTSYSTTSKRNKEPMDTVKRKKIEMEIKAQNEKDDIVVGPRDSKRK